MAMCALSAFRKTVTSLRTVVFAISLLCTNSAIAQTDGDDLLMMLPSILAKALRNNAPTTPVTPPASEGLTALEASLLLAHNQARASARQCGGVLRRAVPALKWNTRLAVAAQTHSADMNRTGIFDHEGSDGSSFGTRATRAGYRWSAVAENIAGGYSTVTSVVDALLNSTGHCNNIMGSRYVDFGAAKVGRYWTMVFARPG